MLDMFHLLNIYDLKDLAYGYTRAYLHSPNTRTRRNRDYGAFEESRLIRTEDNSIFTLLTCPDIHSKADAIQRQAVGSNIQEYFLHIIAHFILNGYRTLPSDKIKIAFCMNHNNAHWTMMLAEYNKIDVKTYEKLFQKYQTVLRRPKQPERNATTDERTHQMNLIRKFIMRQQGIRLHERTKRGVLTSNGRLPLRVESIHLKHYDSMGNDYRDLLQKASKFVAESNKVHVTREKCPHQQGMTCGDWSVYNAFAYGVLKKKTHQPNSMQLRYLKNNLSVHNANQFLRNAPPHLSACHERARLCVTHEERKKMALAYNEEGGARSLMQNVFTFAFNASSYIAHKAWSTIVALKPFNTEPIPTKRKRNAQSL